MKKKILYVEDEPYMARIVKDTLELKGFEVMHRSEGGRIQEYVTSFGPDICLLDVMLPHIDGFAIATHIHHIKPRLPIIFLTAKTQTDDLLKGFASGGSDYLKKPFSMEELIARIENQLKFSMREAAPGQELPEVVRLKDYTFYPGKYELHGPAGIIKLSNREAQILVMLCGHTNGAIDRRELLQAVWGDDSFFNSRNLDVYIRKIRGYFAAGSGIEIVTLKGQGYHFVVS
ncbi:MAG: response regulator transcription factor [Taibaiella sp.]|nr:response regulator transcription factor [Taibaiella sp.]